LTESGEKIALEVIRHHRLLELYLNEALGFGWDEVHEQADVLEHVISEKLEERIANFLGDPKFDPHGDPIPDKDGAMETVPTMPLVETAVGTTTEIARIQDDANSEMLRYLADLGLMPGQTITVRKIAPFDGPLTIIVDGEEKIIGNTIAAAILVKK
jgi:DtxR family Mn-dependent transcriptional regulator